MLFIMMVLLIVVSMVIYVAFVMDQGKKDERGQAILARSSQIAFIFILLGFVLQGFYFQFASPTVDQVETFIYFWMMLVFSSNAISILVLQKKM